MRDKGELAEAVLMTVFGIVALVIGVRCSEPTPRQRHYRIEPIVRVTADGGIERGPDFTIVESVDE
jgi:hypothetical protein